MTIAAVIFDFDGTLVDTLPLHYEAYRTVLADVGVELAPDDFYDNIGGNAAESIPKFLGGRACPIDAAEIHRRKKMVIARLLREREIPVLETAKLIPVFAALVPVALASTGSREGIEIVLDRMSWRRSFKAIVTGEDAPRGKPAPDLFLLAAERLGAEPRDCLVFEDTDAGVAAAQAAGMSVFDVRGAAVPPRAGVTRG